ncbi:protein odr-4 homolog isoform X1 [Canis lupus baileyi]|uniref:Protein odr-4 homolog n=2 Tax=Canis lupus TaxID=9612 RepID=A0A8C0RY52_CANLF|nr:protein odr-4 homolog isoform X1 [Canis lupus familiaris]XP_038398253.1 protein odr-4 homolog isoform X1 [Canis lupus familiaris]XP_038398254.1 protein odr-4 homolog isoform X1 [Canis lupus familiaris]XP_038398255.1 protein odr-4 homolog isoform X1 [Canis lupus familiaris]XP_038398256.1 protein odr-4 homolog isoform X1 [Canis lupus familiaris]XP_048968120.1 protein odr-4 homolog isoform X1 [Canis lupus dingo]XP_048968121.1 protein odr-4 homolog isoform X1 [Canis lupus dingo]XP_048968122.1
MGRTYIVEETVGQYLSNINLQGKDFVSGLLIGQCSSQKDYVILATRTPPKEEQNENLKHQQKAKLGNLDEEWTTEHANQVSRMLPGGLLVLGVFIITTLEMGNDCQNALRRLIFAMEKSLSKRRLWNFTEEEVSERVTLHICSSTKKIVCRTYDIRDPKSSAKPADWKYQNGLSTSWLPLECTVHVNIHIPLSTTSVSYTLEKNTKNGLIRWAKQIENGVYLINGQVKDEDCDLLEGQKKYSRGNVQAASHSFDVKVLTQLILNSDHRSTATVQICSGSVNLKGAVKCRAYVHSNKPKVKDAVQAMKRDILNTVADRCEMLFEDLLLNEIPEKKDSEKEFHILPHRVFVPIPGSTVMLCDYKFGDESAEEMRDHFIEMLDHMIQIEDLEIAEEINTACVSYSMNTEASLDNTDDEQPKQPIKTAVIMKIQQNIGVIAAVVVAVFAAGISFHYFSD